ncbi:hypothetical protein Tco_1360606, partial [Tanacetum coccineum]
MPQTLVLVLAHNNNRNGTSSRRIFNYGHVPKNIIEDFMEWMMQKRSGKPSRTRFGEGLEKGYGTNFNTTFSIEWTLMANSNDQNRKKKFYKKTGRRVRVDGKTHGKYIQQHGRGKGTHEGRRRETHTFKYSTSRSGKGQRRHRWVYVLLTIGMIDCQLLQANEANEIYEKDEKALKDIGKRNDSYKEKETIAENSRFMERFILPRKSLEINDSDMEFNKDSIGKPSYSRFTKTNEFKGVPPPLSGDYTPKPQEEIDDTLYVYGKKGPQKPEISVSDESTSEHSSCQSNDSEGSCENISEHSFETESESLSEPNEMSKSRLEVNNEKDVSAPKSKEVEPSCVSHIKTPRQPLKDKETHKVNRKNWNEMMERELGEGYSFTKKKCFVCGSLSHLIKDCDYYEKKMAREAEVKRVVNTGNGVAKPVWTNASRINHANQFVPRSVQLNAGRPKFNSVRPHINTGRTNINSVRPKVNSVSPKVNSVGPKVNAVNSKVNTVRPKQPVPNQTSNSMSPKRPQMNQSNQRRDFSKSYSSVRRPFAKSTAQMANSNAVMGSWGSAVKTSASYNWRNSRPNFNYNSGPTFIRTVNANGPQGRPKPAKAW